MDTIAAIATPPGVGALALVRVSGSESHEISGRALKGLPQAHPRVTRLYRFIDPETKDVLDEVTAVRYVAPASFTGEDMVEICCHGGAHTGRRIINALVCAGARPAGPGEFSRRAVLNGKMDLLRAEAIREIIEDQSDAGVRSALANYGGAYLPVLGDWRRELLGISSEIEAGLEFGHEEEDVASRRKGPGEIRRRLHLLRESLDRELERRRRICRAEQGVVMPIIGPRNAGKSSLFNALLGAERSIVHHDPGTTRDFISERRSISGVMVTIVDTAGIGNPGNDVEAIGIGRSREYAQQGDLAVWVTPADEEMGEEEAAMADLRPRKSTVCVVTKTDLASPEGKLRRMRELGIQATGISLAGSPGDLADVLALIEEKVAETTPGIEGVCVVQNARHEAIMEKVRREILAADVGIGEGVGEELVAEHLRASLRALDEYEGRHATEEVLDGIFSQFCIGK